MPISTPEPLSTVETENLEELIPTLNRECTWIRNGDPFYNKDRLFVEFQVIFYVIDMLELLSSDINSAERSSG
jgi:hypothetical protein